MRTKILRLIFLPSFEKTEINYKSSLTGLELH